MDDPLRDAWVKHARALDHIQALNAACGEVVWGQPKAYRIDVAFEPDAECHVARFVQLGSPDARLGAMVGDVAHNLRVGARRGRLAARHPPRPQGRESEPTPRGVSAESRRESLPAS